MVVNWALPLQQKSGVAVFAQPLALPARVTVARGLQAVVANCLAQIRGNESGVVGGSEPECVHQMRVGLRRLNSALKLFRGVASCPLNLLLELSWVRRELGAARDWEVLAHETLAEVPAMVPDGLVQLRKVTANRAGSSRRRAAAAVKSERYRQCMVSVESWVGAIGHDGSEQLTAPLKMFSKHVLKRHHARLMKRGKKLREADAERRHRVRIAAKKMRYAAEFFQSLCPPAKTQAYIKALAALQTVLGELNDIVVAEDLLRQLVKRQPLLADGAWFVRGYLAGRGAGELRHLFKAWKKFIRVPSPV
ncbi:MAG: inorganic triphosphatase [Burkholderiaceae bacterium]|nr:inorganic triphosphatase [Burkholderiaceae bacterium]